MSYSTLYKIYKTKCVEAKEYSNSWGSAPIIWDYLFKTYLTPRFEYDSWMTYKPIQDLWDLTADKRVPFALRVISAFCSDKGYIPKEHLAEAGGWMIEGYNILHTFAPTFVNHWQEIGKDLIKISESKDSRLIGVALNCTSCGTVWPQSLDGTFDIFSALEK